MHQRFKGEWCTALPFSPFVAVSHRVAWVELDSRFACCSQLVMGRCWVASAGVARALPAAIPERRREVGAAVEWALTPGGLRRGPSGDGVVRSYTIHRWSVPEDILPNRGVWPLVGWRTRGLRSRIPTCLIGSYRHLSNRNKNRPRSAKQASAQHQ